MLISVTWFVSRINAFAACIAIILFCNSSTLSKTEYKPELNSPQSGIYLNFHAASGTVYSGGGVHPNAIIIWTIDENIGTSTNRNVVQPTTQCPPFLQNCNPNQYRILINVSSFCSGDTAELSAYMPNNGNGGTGSFVYNMSGGFSNVGYWGSKFQCSGYGGNPPPDPAHTPVIVVPGIMGSELKGPYAGETVQYWTNFTFSNDPSVTTVRNLTLDSTSQYYRTGIYASDILRNVNITIANVPFRVQPIYEPLLTNLSNMGYNRPYDINRHFVQGQGCDLSLKNPDLTRVPNLFVFPYDWRQDNNQTSFKLAQYVKCVQQLYPSGSKVNIIAHSMGGLVVRRYILNSRQGSFPDGGTPHRIKKLITLASPFLGSPESTYKLYTGGDLEQFSFAVSPESIKQLAPYFPSMHQLLPSRKYHELRRGIIEEIGDADGNGIANEIYDFGRIINQLNTVFPNTSPGTVGAGFHDFSGQDDWRNDTFGVGIKYFHILGQQKQFLTTDALYAKKSNRCRWSSNRLLGCVKIPIYIPKKGPGDKTVPLVSTTMGWIAPIGSQPVNLAPPSMRIFVRNSLSANTDKQVAEHVSMTGDQKVRDLIAYFLDVGQQPTLNQELVELNRPGNVSEFMPDLSDYDPSYYLTIVGKKEVKVQDETANTAVIENGFLKNNVAGLSNYEMIGDESVMLTLKTNHSYAVEFRTSTTPLGIELVNGRGNFNPNTAVRYNDLDLPANINVRLTFSQAGATELRIDADNNGTFETLIPPTVNLSGTAASDVAPPSVSINVIAGQGNTAIATVTAEDFGSGVNKIWYSLDGQTFDQYASPVTINLTSNPVTIEAFADDNAANRSGLVSRTVRLTSTVIPTVDCIALENEEYKAWFGYQNQTSSAVTIAVGVDNTFYPLPTNKGQTTAFQTGTISRAFSVLMRGKRLDWRLRGQDGLLRTATASFANTPRCQ